MDVKKEKLFKFIQGIKEELTDEEKNEIVEYQKWLNEQGKPKKKREGPWVIIRREKRQDTSEERPEIPQKEWHIDKKFIKDTIKSLKAREKRRENPPTRKKK